MTKPLRLLYRKNTVSINENQEKYLLIHTQERLTIIIQIVPCKGLKKSKPKLMVKQQKRQFTKDRL